jgi:dephospho-CoA kinase
MLDIGLTGGIGSGKSTVARMLAARGAVVIDADRLAREALAPGTDALARVVELFGPEVLDPDGALDRGALATRVFSDPQALARLEDVVHPAVADLTRRRRAAAGEGAVVVHDVPLLVEKGLGDRYDLVVVVDAPDEVRLARLVGRGMTEDDARARMAAQVDRETRLAAADVVLANDGDLGHLEAQVEDLWESLRGRGSRPVGGTA